MKTLKRSTTGLLLVVMIFGLTIPQALSSTAANAVSANSQKKAKDFKVKKGSEVAARVRALKENNENVRAALRYFERKGKPPKIDDSFAIYGSTHSSNTATLNNSGGLMRSVSFTRQDSSISDANVEIIFVPAYSVEGEWQGTVIANRYDDYGNFVEQYVAESVLSTPDPNTYSWDEVYEAPSYGGEVQAPINEPGMYTDYNWGSTRQEQPQESIYTSKSKDALSRGGAKLVHANAVQSRRARIRAWARCSFAWCGGAAVGCIAANIWNAEFLAGPCFAVGCTGAAIGCTWGTLWQ